MEITQHFRGPMYLVNLVEEQYPSPSVTADRRDGLLHMEMSGYLISSTASIAFPVKDRLLEGKLAYSQFLDYKQQILKGKQPPVIIQKLVV